MPSAYRPRAAGPDQANRAAVDVKTTCHYTVRVALLNVRLAPEDVRRVADLRRDGIQISKLVRDAIRAEHEQRGRSRRAGRDAAALIARIYEDHPDTQEVRPRPFDLRDRRAVRQAIVARLRKRRA